MQAGWFRLRISGSLVENERFNMINMKSSLRCMVVVCVLGCNFYMVFLVQFIVFYV